MLHINPELLVILVALCKSLFVFCLVYLPFFFFFGMVEPALHCIGTMTLCVLAVKVAEMLQNR